MKACPECQTKNQESGRFCSKPGSEFARASYCALISVVAVAVVLGGVAFWPLQGAAGADPRGIPQPPVRDKTDYWRQAIRMTEIPVKVENGKISIPLDVVKEKKIVRFEHEGNGVKIPILSYVTQTGKVVTAVSICEPCRSTRFHIKEKSIVCNSCYTEWDLETLKGIKGGCLKYPPDAIPNTLENGRILIDEKTVTQWKPRV